MLRTSLLHAATRMRLRQARTLGRAIQLAFAAAVALAQTPVAQAFSGDWAGTNGAFSFVAYNVAGLPAFLGSTGKDPARTTPDMGRRLLRFDVLNVQEDFNCHAALYSTTTAYGYRTATTGGVPFGSGLNTMSYLTVGGLQRIKWNNCRNEDCLTPKGFTFQRLMVGQGSYVDLAHSGLRDTWIQAAQGNATPPVGPANVCPKGSETRHAEPAYAIRGQPDRLPALQLVPGRERKIEREPRQVDPVSLQRRQHPALLSAVLTACFRTLPQVASAWRSKTSAALRIRMRYRA